MATRYAPMDALTTFCEGMNLTASDVVAQSGTDVVLRIGAGWQDMVLVLDVTALDIVSNDESYTFLLQGSNGSNMAAPLENLAQVTLGATEVRPGGARDSVVGQYIIPCSTIMQAEYKYVRLNVIIAGTTPTITFDAWLTKPEAA